MRGVYLPQHRSGGGPHRLGMFRDPVMRLGAVIQPIPMNRLNRVGIAQAIASIRIVCCFAASRFS